MIGSLILKKPVLMKKLKLVSIFLFLLLGFVAQSKGQNVFKVQKEFIKNEVDSVFQKMLIFAEEINFNGLSSGVDDKHEAGFITNGKYYADYPSLISDFKSNAQGISHQDISIKDKKITVLSPKNVLMTASGVAKATLKDGRVITANFHWSFVYELIDNNWKVIYSHQSLAK